MSTEDEFKKLANQDHKNIKEALETDVMQSFLKSWMSPEEQERLTERMSNPLYPEQ